MSTDNGHGKEPLPLHELWRRNDLRLKQPKVRNPDPLAVWFNRWVALSMIALVLIIGWAGHSCSNMVAGLKLNNNRPPPRANHVLDERARPKFMFVDADQWPEDEGRNQPRPRRKGPPPRRHAPATPLPESIIAYRPVPPIAPGTICERPDNYLEARSARKALDGSRVASRDGRHHAVDVMMSIGTPVRAALGGRVHHILERRNGSAGIAVEICHDAVMTGNHCANRTRYLHLDSVNADLDVGDVVRAGQTIGRSGDTGTLHMVEPWNKNATPPHLHFELWWQNRSVDPTELFALCLG